MKDDSCAKTVQLWQMFNVQVTFIIETGLTTIGSIHHLRVQTYTNGPCLSANLRKQFVCTIIQPSAVTTGEDLFANGRGNFIGLLVLTRCSVSKSCSACIVFMIRRQGEAHFKPTQ